MLEGNELWDPQEMWERVKEGCSWGSVAVIGTRLGYKPTYFSRGRDCALTGHVFPGGRERDAMLSGSREDRTEWSVGSTVGVGRDEGRMQLV